MAFIEIEGRLGNDPESVKTQKSQFTSLKIAENRDYFDRNLKAWVKKDPSWFNVLCFGKVGEKSMSLKKGDRVLIKGSLDQTKKTIEGENKYSLSISAKSIRKIDSIQSTVEDGLPSFDSSEEIHF